MSKLNRPTALCIGAVALIVGLVSPWITVLGFISAGPTNFTEVWTVMIVGTALVVVSALTGKLMRFVSIVVGLAVLSEVGYVWFHLSEKDSSKVGDLIQPGWGLYLSTLAGLYLIASTWVARQRAQ
jgi:hypothetical protein